ncbi:hypothetical protein [Bacillus thuringiensis]|uniref:hypothetical protein n=1 Tax=Bacillus thuringiensis TaxID=1428 RepID=UPI0037DD80E5
MKKAKKRYIFTYYGESEKQPDFYEIKEKIFYKSEKEYSQKIVKLKKLEFLES